MDEEKVDFKKIILTTISVVGLVGVAVLAPNVLRVIKQFSDNGKSKRKYNQKYYTKKVISRLLNKGFMKIEEKDGQKFVRLTEKGKNEVEKYRWGELEIKKPNKWDSKWRIVVFDIKEGRRKTRDLLRFTLVRLGFEKLQNSVWVFPYDCEELVALLKSDLFLGKDVLYIKADSIENDGWLKEVFELD